MYDPRFDQMLSQQRWTKTERHQLDTFFASISDAEYMLNFLSDLANSDCPNNVFASQFVRLMRHSVTPISGKCFEMPISRQEWSSAFNGEVHENMVAILASRGYDDELMPAWKVADGFQTSISVESMIFSLQTLSNLFNVSREFLGRELTRCLGGRLYQSELEMLKRAVLEILKTYPWHNAFADAWENLIGDDTVFYDPVSCEAAEALPQILEVPNRVIRRLAPVR